MAGLVLRARPLFSQDSPSGASGMDREIKVLKPALETELDSFRANIRMLIHNSHYNQAEKTVMERVKINPNDIAALNLLLQIYSESGHREKAETLFKDVMRRHIGNKETFDNMLEYCTVNCSASKTKQFFEMMVVRGVADERSKRFMLRVYGDEGDIERMWDLFRETHAHLSMKAYHEVFNYLLAGREHNDKAAQAFSWLLERKADCNSPVDARYVEKTCGLLVMRMIKENKFDEALNFIEANAACTPDPRALTVLLTELGNRGRLEEMVSVGNKLASTGKCDAILFTILIKKCVAAMRHADAEKFYQLAVAGHAKNRENTCDAFVFGTMLNSYHSHGDLKTARGVFDDAERRNCADTMVHNTMLSLYKDAGMMDAAREIFDKALAKDVADLATYDAICRGYLLLHEPQKGAEILDIMFNNGAFEKISDKRFLVVVFETYFYLGNLEMMTKFFKTPEGRAFLPTAHGMVMRSYADDLRRFPALKPHSLEKHEKIGAFLEYAVSQGTADHNVVLNMLMGYRALQDWENMFDVFTIAEKNGLLTVESCSYMLDTLGELGNLDLARQFFDNTPAALKQIGVYNTMLKIYAKAGRLNDARKLYDYLLGKPGFADVITYGTMLNCHLSAGNLAECMNVYRAAKAVAKADAMLCHGVFIILYKNRRYSEIEKIFYESSDAVKDDAIVFLARLEATRKLGKYKQAIQELDAFIEKYPHKNYQDEIYVHALVIRAFCLIYNSGPADGMAEFNRLRHECPPASVHCARILCGYVFAAADASLLNTIDREAIRKQLESLPGPISNGIVSDVRSALEILANKKDGRSTNLH